MRSPLESEAARELAPTSMSAPVLVSMSQPLSEPELAVCQESPWARVRSSAWREEPLPALPDLPPPAGRSVPVGRLGSFPHTPPVSHPRGKSTRPSAPIELPSASVSFSPAPQTHTRPRPQRSHRIKVIPYHRLLVSWASPSRDHFVAFASTSALLMRRTPLTPPGHRW